MASLTYTPDQDIIQGIIRDEEERRGRPRTNEERLRMTEAILDDVLFHLRLKSAAGQTEKSAALAEFVLRSQKIVEQQRMLNCPETNRLTDVLNDDTKIRRITHQYTIGGSTTDSKSVSN